MLEPLNKTRLYEQIVDQLVSLITDGTLKAGDKLPSERTLSEDLNVSRTAIREALRSMESMGYLESKPGGGTYVKSITLNNVLDPFSSILTQDEKLIEELIEVRQLLESELAFLAAKRITPEKCNFIESSLEEMQKEVDKGNYGLSGENHFHDAIAKAAENTAMSKILEMCGGLLSKTRESTLRIPGQPLKSVDDHRAIFDAIKNGESEMARQLMRSHLIKAQQNYTAHYGSSKK